MSIHRHNSQRAHSRQVGTSGENAKDDPTSDVCLDLIDYNAALKVDGLTIDHLRLILSENPTEYRVFTAKGEMVIHAHALYSKDDTFAIPGISSKHYDRYREIGLLAKDTGNRHMFDGRRIIGYFMGNLKAVVRMEELLRQPVHT